MVVLKVLKVDNLKNILDESIISHCSKKYSGKNLTDSLFAYETLSMLYKRETGNNLLGIYFDDRGKPLSNEIAITITHSNGVVGVGFSLNTNDKIAIDIEKVKSVRKPLLKLLNLNENATKQEFYLKWTKKECFKKALNLPLLKSKEIDFKGKSEIVKIDGEEYALSVYCEKDFKIEL